jgi:DNA polymerase-3 subunit epsilon
VFAAIDFETADHGRDSACAIGVVLVRDGRITDRFSALIRPPRSRVMFTEYHGLTWAMLRDQPGFASVWPQVALLLEPAQFLAAHNAPFDRRILHGCCEAFACPRPPQEFHCTYRLTKKLWPGGPSYKLPDICRRLRIPQVHHHAADADAEACARLMLSVLEKERLIAQTEGCDASF